MRIIFLDFCKTYVVILMNFKVYDYRKYLYLNRNTINFTTEYSFVTSGIDDYSYYHVSVSIN